MIAAVSPFFMLAALRDESPTGSIGGPGPDCVARTRVALSYRAAARLQGAARRLEDVSIPVDRCHSLGPRGGGGISVQHDPACRSTDEKASRIGKDGQS